MTVLIVGREHDHLLDVVDHTPTRQLCCSCGAVLYPDPQHERYVLEDVGEHFGSVAL